MQTKIPHVHPQHNPDAAPLFFRVDDADRDWLCLVPQDKKDDQTGVVFLGFDSLDALVAALDEDDNDEEHGGFAWASDGNADGPERFWRTDLCWQYEGDEDTIERLLDGEDAAISWLSVAETIAIVGTSRDPGDEPID